MEGNPGDSRTSMNYRSYADLAADIADGLHKVQHTPFDLVVGLPRSGMVPAYMLASLLNVDCMDLQSFVDNGPVLHGIRRHPRYSLTRAWDARRVLLIDDSVYTGESMRQALQRIPPACPAEFTRLAVYATSRQPPDVDIHLQRLPLPRVFQWNIFHHSVLDAAAVDIDGVLCRDPTPDENDDGPAYDRFLRSAEPLILPSYPIHSLVTNRLERYRQQTEAWLARHSVRYRQLIMLDLPSKAERQRLRIHARHKAEFYRGTNLSLFIESSASQARDIGQMTGRPVFCTANNELYGPDLSSSLLSAKRYQLWRLSRRWLKRLPPTVRHRLRHAYHAWRSS